MPSPGFRGTLCRGRIAHRFLSYFKSENRQKEKFPPIFWVLPSRFCDQRFWYREARRIPQYERW